MESPKNDLGQQKSILKSCSTFICNYCNKEFIHRLSFENHIRLHTGERPYACELCGENFIRRPDLKYHRMKHTGEKPFVCDICQTPFARYQNLKGHMRTQHSDWKPRTSEDYKKLRTFRIVSRQSHVCEVCKKTFPKKSLLVKHSVVHSSEQSQVCHICQKTVRGSGNFNRHVAVHNRPKPSYGCQFCQRTFSRKYGLELHTRTHTGEKPYACKFCPKAFPARNRLNMHIRARHRDKLLKPSTPEDN